MACAYLYNFFLETSAKEQEEIAEEIANFSGNLQNPSSSDQLSSASSDSTNSCDEEENIPMSQDVNPRERRRLGNVLLSNTISLYREMHGF